MKTEEYTPHKSFVKAFPSAFRIYNSIDVIRLVKPKEELNADEPRSTTRE